MNSYTYPLISYISYCACILKIKIKNKTIAYKYSHLFQGTDNKLTQFRNIPTYILNRSKPFLNEIAFYEF